MRNDQVLVGSTPVAVARGPCTWELCRRPPPWTRCVRVALIATQAQVLVLALRLSAPPLVIITADCRRGLWGALDPGRRGDTRCCSPIRRVTNANAPRVVITEAVRASRDGLGSPRKSLVIKASVDHRPVEIPPCQRLPPELSVVEDPLVALVVPLGPHDKRLVRQELGCLPWVPQG